MSIQLVIATTTQISWTPEVFYGAVAIVQLIAVLVGFRVMGVPSKYNTFINAGCVVVVANLVAYFTIGLAMIGGLVTATVLYLLLLASSRGEVLKSFAVWLLALSMYWASAYYVVEMEYALEVEELGPIPHLFLEGELEGGAVTQDDYQRVRNP